MICHDCGKELKRGDEYIKYGEFAKCRKCNETDPILRNFQECEVYSRVVGYIRPVNNWNKGKRAEFEDRKVFSYDVGFPESDLA